LFAEVMLVVADSIIEKAVCIYNRGAKSIQDSNCIFKELCVSPSSYSLSPRMQLCRARRFEVRFHRHDLLL